MIIHDVEACSAGVFRMFRVWVLARDSVAPLCWFSLFWAKIKRIPSVHRRHWRYLTIIINQIFSLVCGWLKCGWRRWRWRTRLKWQQTFAHITQGLFAFKVRQFTRDKINNVLPTALANNHSYYMLRNQKRDHTLNNMPSNIIIILGTWINRLKLCSACPHPT